MLPTDNLFIITLFIIPASIYILFNRYIRSTPVSHKDSAVLFSSVLIFSFLAFTLNFLLYENYYTEFVNQEAIFDSKWLLAKIIFVNITLSFLYSIFWFYMQEYINNLIIKFIYKFYGEQKIFKYEDMRGYIFKDGENRISLIKKNFTVLKKDKSKEKNIKIEDLLNLECCILRLEKDGLATAGILCGYSSSTCERIDFIISNVNEIEKILKKDSVCKEEEKILNKINFVYFDVTNNLKVTIYNTDKYQEYVKNK